MITKIIKVPDIGEGIAEVELVEWHVQPGDPITQDQPLAEVMTDKAAVEIPSPVAGKILSLGGRAGEMMQVGSDLVCIEVTGTTGEQTKVIPTAAASSPTESAAGQQPASVTSQAGEWPSGEKPLASPSVRQHARECDVDLHRVAGSGPGGRIRHEDIEAFAATRLAPSAPSMSHHTQDWEETVPVIGLRRKIAQKMREAKQHIPHFTYVEEIDMTECEALRAQLNEKHASARGHLTLLPMLVRALVVALREYPQINTLYDDAADMMTRYGAVHLGIATQIEGGLVVPVLRHAETHDLWSCAREIARLAEAARSGKARREELSGSTITLTSLGALGGIVSTPIINHPEVAIIGINRMVERPMIRNGQCVARRMMNLSSSFDHRVVDGMDAARFIQAMRAYLEQPAMLFVE